MNNWPTQSTLWQIAQPDCQHPGKHLDVKKSASGVVKSRARGGDRFIGVFTRKRDHGMGIRSILSGHTLFTTQLTAELVAQFVANQFAAIHAIYVIHAIQTIHFVANQFVVNSNYRLSLVGPGTPYRSGNDRLLEPIPS